MTCLYIGKASHEDLNNPRNIFFDYRCFSGLRIEQITQHLSTNNDYKFLSEQIKEVTPRPDNTFIKTIIFNYLQEYNVSPAEDAFRYWDLLIGHWFDRITNLIEFYYYKIVSSQEMFNFSKISVQSINERLFETNSTLDWIYLMEDDIWHDTVLAKVSKVVYPDIPLVVREKELENSISSHQRFGKSTLSIPNNISRILSRFQRHTSPVIESIYMSRWETLKLKLSLFIAPKSSQLSVRYPNFSYNKRIREEISKYLQYRHLTPKQKVVVEILVMSIPKCFLEGYKLMSENSIYQRLPNRPRYILTANAFDTNEYFKFYLAEKSSASTKYFVVQHGNNYHTHRFFSPSLEERYSDHFLTWGKKKCKDARYIPIGITTKKLRCDYTKSKSLLIIQEPRYWPYNLFDTLRRYYYNCLELDQILENIKADIRQASYLKLKADQKVSDLAPLYLLKKHPGLRLLPKDTKFSSAVSQSRLILFTYDSSGFLQAIADNVPAIMYLGCGLNHLTDEAKVDYEKLIEANIIFTCTNRIVEHINNTWDDVETWWNSKLVRDAIATFSELYAYRDTKPTWKHLRDFCKSV